MLTSSLNSCNSFSYLCSVIVYFVYAIIFIIIVGLLYVLYCLQDVDENEVQDKCYDRYLISLTSLQILLCCKGNFGEHKHFKL